MAAGRAERLAAEWPVALGSFPALSPLLQGGAGFWAQQMGYPGCRDLSLGLSVCPRVLGLWSLGRRRTLAERSSTGAHGKGKE